MALNFSDKQKWVATLEAIITHSPDTFKRKDAVSMRPENKKQSKMKFLFLRFKFFPLWILQKETPLFSHYFLVILQKLLGNTILTTSDEKRLEINCSLSLSDKVCSSVLELIHTERLSVQSLFFLLLPTAHPKTTLCFESGT